MTGSTGPLASEAAQLLEVIAQRLERWREQQRAVAGAEDGAGATDGDGAAPAPDQPGDGDTSDRDVSDGEALDRDGRCPRCGHRVDATACTACPLCAVMALVRGERPETAGRLVDGALTIVDALRGLVASRVGEGPTTPGADPHDGDPDGRAAPGAPGLIRIDVR